MEMVYFKRSYLLLNPHSSANEENLSIREPLDADEPGTVPLHRIDLLDAVQGDAPVDVGADPLLRRPILTHLLLADGHGLLVPHDDPKIGPQNRTAELEADPVARHVLSKNYSVFESDTD